MDVGIILSTFVEMRDRMNSIRAYKKNFNLITTRCQNLCDTLTEMQSDIYRDHHSPGLRASIKRLENLFVEINEFVKQPKFTATLTTNPVGVMKSFFSSRSDTSQFVSLNEQLDSCVQDLQLTALCELVMGSRLHALTQAVHKELYVNLDKGTKFSLQEEEAASVTSPAPHVEVVEHPRLMAKEPSPIAASRLTSAPPIPPGSSDPPDPPVGGPTVESSPEKNCTLLEEREEEIPLPCSALIVYPQADDVYLDVTLKRGRNVSTPQYVGSYPNTDSDALDLILFENDPADGKSEFSIDAFILPGIPPHEVSESKLEEGVFKEVPKIILKSFLVEKHVCI
jgi:hypothetical protein